MKNIILLEKIYNKSVATGSRILGGVTEQSDHDYIIKEKDFSEIYNEFQNDFAFTCPSGYGEYSDTESVKVVVSNKVVNLIVCKKDEVYKGWVRATEDYLKYIDKDSVTDKQTRIKLFQLFYKYHNPTCTETPARTIISPAIHVRNDGRKIIQLVEDQIEDLWKSIEEGENSDDVKELSKLTRTVRVLDKLLCNIRSIVSE